MESLTDIDQQLFFFVNQQLRNSFFDFIMPWLREKYFWIPVYALILIAFIIRFRKYSWIAVLGVILTVVATDQISSSIIKPIVHRLRPCNNPEMLSQIHLLVGCGSGYSFISSHAANHFGFALFIIILLRDRFRWITVAALLWAALVSFAQVYVGLHYPADVTAGALLGSLIGWGTGSVCKNVLMKKNPSVFK